MVVELPAVAAVVLVDAALSPPLDPHAATIEPVTARAATTERARARISCPSFVFVEGWVDPLPTTTPSTEPTGGADDDHTMITKN
jgi:hypothetical protein